LLISQGGIMDHFKLFRLLFRDTDSICYGDFKAVDVRGQPQELHEFFSINPLDKFIDRIKSDDGSIEKYIRSRRADLNVTRFHNFLFEMDGRPLTDQLEILKTIQAAGVKLASIVYSGGKSYHAIISLEEPLNASPHTFEGLTAYKATWDALALKLSSLAGFKSNIFDSACKNPSRLSRFPGYTADGRQKQDLLYLGTLTTASDLYNLIGNLDNKAPTYQQKREKSVETEEELRLMLPVELAAKLKYPKTWIKGAEGNYGEIFKLALWAIDSTGCNQEMLVSLFQKKAFPDLLAAGYPASKLMKPLEDALRLKGML
jgi:hypothetical protein